MYVRDRGCKAYLVNSNLVRVARFGGNWYNGANDGLSIVNGNNNPGNANANYGGDLYFQPFGSALRYLEIFLVATQGILFSLVS